MDGLRAIRPVDGHLPSPFILPRDAWQRIGKLTKSPQKKAEGHRGCQRKTWEIRVAGWGIQPRV